MPRLALAQLLLLAATSLQIIAVVYCVLLLRKHRIAAAAWLCLLGALLSMLVWRVVVTTGVTPAPVFNIAIAIWGSVCAVLAMFFFGREVGRRERAEAERDRLLESERSARSEAERANLIKDEFLATLSHELRTPLTAILGWCSILRNSSGELADVARAVRTIERNARIQTRLVDDLLDATRMQAGALHLDIAPLSLDGPVSAAIEGIRPSARAKRVSLEYMCASPAPTVLGDANRLQQVASNLLVNAVKFTPEGGRIRIALATAGAQAELTVADEGIGLDEAFMPQLFERFRQADGSNSRRQGGLGLGLSIAASLVELHQGEIKAASDGPGRGSTFTVRLPLTTAAPAPAATQRLTDQVTEPHRALETVRVLIVDDEADVREAVARLLERSGASVLPLESGGGIQAALTDFRPDVLLLDISMPGEDGYALMRRVRGLAAHEGGTVPAVSLTAHAREEDRAHAMASGFQAHLPKPVHLPLLVSTIRRLVRQQGSPERVSRTTILPPDEIAS